MFHPHSVEGGADFPVVGKVAESKAEPAFPHLPELLRWPQIHGPGATGVSGNCCFLFHPCSGQRLACILALNLGGGK